MALSAPITATIVNPEGGNDRVPFLLDAGIAFSFDNVQLTTISSVNGPASGDQILTFTGSNFGTFDATVRNRIGPTACEQSIWAANTAVTCKNSPGIAANQGIIVSLAMGKNTISELFTYDTHKPLYVFPTNSITFGSGTVTITGYGFGFTDYTPAVSLRTSHIVGGAACLASRWMSDSTVLCKLPADTAQELNVVVTLNQVRKTLEKVFTYNNPEVFAVTPSNMPHTGNIRLTIQGANFGASRYNPRSSRLGDTACLDTIWFSDTSMSCRSQRGYSNNLNVVVTVASYEVRKRLLSYDSPRTDALVPSNGPASGNTFITLIGNSFGAFELTQQVRIGATACPQTRWVSTSTIVCKLPSVPYTKWFLGEARDVQARIGKASFGYKQSFTYDAACVGPCVVKVCVYVCAFCQDVCVLYVCLCVFCQGVYVCCQCVCVYVCMCVCFPKGCVCASVLVLRALFLFTCVCIHIHRMYVCMPVFMYSLAYVSMGCHHIRFFLGCAQVRTDDPRLYTHINRYVYVRLVCL